MDTPAAGPAPLTKRTRPARWEIAVVVVLLSAATAAALHSAQRDSVTIDELAHLTAGMSFWKTGDFRLLFATPPLAQMWAALPLQFGERAWPSPESPDWHHAEVWRVGRAWFLGENNAATLIDAPRLMMIAVLIATLLTIYACARRLFGIAGGLLALTVATASPALLAHGRLVTTDVPISLAMLGIVLSFAAWVQRPTILRALIVAVVLSVAALVKYTFVLALPAMLAIAIVAVLREVRRPRRERWRDASRSGIPAAGHTLRGLGIALALFLLVPWLSIWTCFGWRYAAHIGPDRDYALMIWLRDGRPEPADMSEVWTRTATLADGRPLTGVTASFVHLARGLRLLPEAYLFGLLYTVRTAADERSAYMLGEYSDSGWYSYFPLCMATKMPIGTQVVVLLALAALVLRRDRWHAAPLLLTGIATLAVAYFAAAVVSKFNIGERHLLPAYVPLFILCGAAVAWLPKLVGKILIGGAVGWSVFAVALAHPHYLPYFNETVGGAANGYKLVLDSNVDWGQDLKRLAELQSNEQTRLAAPDDVRLFYFGSAPPLIYGITSPTLVNHLGVGDLRDVTPGTYVISMNELYGLLNPIARRQFWNNPRLQSEYRRLVLLAAGTSAGTELRGADRSMLSYMRIGRLMIYLQNQTPVARIGYSFAAYHVTPAMLEEALRP